MSEARKLDRGERRFLVVLGVPALGMAFAVTVVSTYVPVLLEEVSNPVVTGSLIGAEGFFGIFLPALVGHASDRRSRTVRDRMPPLVGFAVVVTVALAALGMLAVTGTLTLWSAALALVVLYAGYYAFLAPYWTLFPDLVPRELSGRSTSAEGTWRVLGTGLALVGGGLLLHVSTGLPFLVAAGLVAVVVTVLALGLGERLSTEVHRGSGDRTSLDALRELLEDRQVRRLAVANGLWNFALMALRAFVVLFFVSGLERSTAFVSTVVFPLVAVGIGVAAPLSGWAADRFGHGRLVLVSVALWGVLMAAPAVTHSAWLVASIPVVAAGAAVVMTLPLSLLQRLVPEERHGAASGLFGISRGLGSTLGPVVAGIAVMVLAPVFDDTDGYAAMWLVCSAALLASLVPTWQLARDERLR